MYFYEAFLQFLGIVIYQMLRRKRAGELVEVLADRKVDVACIQETRWKGDGCRLFGAKGRRYKLFWKGGKEKSDGVGIFVAEKWVDSVVSVDRRSERVMILKLVIDSGLLNILTVYAPHTGKPEDEKEKFWNELFDLVSCILKIDMGMGMVVILR